MKTMGISAPPPRPDGVVNDAATVAAVFSAAIRARERRRLSRRRLMPSVAVTLRPAGEDGAVSGVLLNISPGGVACRVRSADARAFRRERDCRVDFTLGRPPQSFRLPASVITTTPCAEEGMILGLEFRPDGGEPARLASALSSLKEEEEDRS
jgi:hypothetical protein